MYMGIWKYIQYVKYIQTIYRIVGNLGRALNLENQSTDFFQFGGMTNSRKHGCAYAHNRYTYKYCQLTSE